MANLKDAGAAATEDGSSTLRGVLLVLRGATASDAFKLIFAGAVFTAALWLLRRELQASSIGQIEAALRSTPGWSVAAAATATLLSYVCLAGSEWWALACLRQKLAAKRVLLVTFVAYALSNGLGFSVATGGAARLRFYRAWGLSPSQVAAVTFLAGTAVTLSGLVAAGLALFTIGGLPAGVYGIGALLVALAWLWLGRLPRSLVFLPAVELSTPPWTVRAGALASGLLDWVLSGLALFVLTPSVPLEQFPPFLAVFVLGSVVSAASGVPGGIGVFEAVVLVLSRRFALTHETAAALVLYRLIYAIGPLSLTAAGLAAHQAPAVARGHPGARLRSVAEALAPPVMAGLAFALGAALLLAAAKAPIHLAGPSAVIAELPPSRLSSSLVGALLLFVAATLWRRQEAAYVVSLLLLTGGAALELWRGFGLASAAPLLLLALVLAPCRFAFDRRSSLLRDFASAPWLLAIGLAGVSALLLAFLAQREGALADQPWWMIVRVPGAAGTLAVAAGLASLGLFFGVWRLLGPSRPLAAPGSAADMARARAIISATQEVSCDALLALLGDKSFVFSPSGRSFVMFRQRGAHWLAMSDPVGPIDDRADAIEAFLRAADEAQCEPAFYGVEQASLPALIDAGFLIHKIGECAAIDVQGFSLKGKTHEDIRHAVNHALRAGLTFEVLQAGDPATPWEELKAVSDAWLAGHTGAEKSFTLGRFDRACLANFPVALLRGPEGVVAFANLLTTPDGVRFGPDLMRSRRDAPHGAVDALFAHLIEWGRARGFRQFELGMAPLAGLEPTSVAPWSRRLEAWIYGAGEGLYGFKGLRAYKQKFGPTRRPVYLATPAGLSPVTALADVGALASGGVWRALSRRRAEPHSPP